MLVGSTRLTADFFHEKICALFAGGSDVALPCDGRSTNFTGSGRH